MKRLNVFFLTATLALSSTVAAQKSDIIMLKENLKPWQPSKVYLDGNQITIATPGTNLNSETYNSIISSGICTPIWLKEVPANYLEKIKQINVTNKFESIGFSFENPVKVCKEMGNLMDKPAQAVMMGNTHIYNNGK